MVLGDILKINQKNGIASVDFLLANRPGEYLHILIEAIPMRNASSFGSAIFAEKFKF